MFPVSWAVAMSQDALSRQVEFRFVAPKGATSVAVVGQFNEWDRARHPMRFEGGVWQVTVEIAAGVYQYLFVVDGKHWVKDPHARSVADANGNTNSALIVEPADYEAAPAIPGDGTVTLSAVRHRPDHQDTVRKNRTEVLLRVRTRRGDVGTVEAVPVGIKAAPLRLARFDALYDYWQGVVPSPSGEFAYRFRLDGATWLGADGLGPAPTPFVQRPREMPLPDVPRWLEGAVFYQVFPDRFENGDPANDPAGVAPWGSKPTPTNWLGGDLAGVTQRLPHLQDLGVTGLYLNPVFKTQSNHGYTTDDYRSVDPRFGNTAEMKRLVTMANDSGIKVLLDGVFNHSGTGYAPFRSVAKEGAASPFAKFFHVLRFPIEEREGQQTYRTFAGVWQMPKLATHEPEVQREIADIGTYWVRECGVAGWRLDVADEVAPECWRVFRKAVKQADPEAYILGEVWGDAREWLQGDMFDGVMNYRWREAVIGYIAGTLRPSELESRLRTIAEDYPDGVAMGLFNILGSHDTERLRRIVPARDLRMIAATLQFTWPGVPCIYYGDEVGMDGGRDPDDRMCMDWSQAGWDFTLLQHYKDLSALRAQQPALRVGHVGKIVSLDVQGVFAFRRDAGSNRVWVVTNLGASEATIPLGPGRWEIVAGKGRIVEGSVRVPRRGSAVIARAG